MEKNDHSQQPLQLLKQREYAQLTEPEGTLQFNQFNFKQYQLFVYNMMQFYNDKYRFLVKHGTGTGKTITALLVAKSYQDNNHNVIILSNIKERYYNDMIKFYQIGLVNQDTTDEYTILEKQLNNKQIDIRTFKQKRKKLLFGKVKIDIYGYKKFNNLLFGRVSTITPATINIEMIKQLNNSIIICDEIHNVYNSMEKNQYGVAIMFISQFLQKNVKIMLMSGTPINNSAEIYDLCNILYDDNLHYIKDFDEYIKKQQTMMKDNQDDYIKKQLDKQLFKDRQSSISEDILVKVFSNKVSFYPQGYGQGDVPRVVSHGDKLPGMNDLNLYVCKYGYYEKIISQLYTSRKDIKERDIFDFAYVEGDHTAANIIYPRQFGQRKPKDKNIIVEKNGQKTFISGGCLYEDQIDKYSSKYHNLLQLVIKSQGKSLIYHNNVNNTGILTVRELLIYNGFLELNGAINPQTICYQCGKKISQHKKDQSHIPLPARFAMMYGEQSQQQNEQVIMQFNNTQNNEGQLLKIIIGSRLIREGVDFRHMKNLFILSLPRNIPGLIQVMGRAVREGSLKHVPQEQRFVNIYVLVSELYEYEDYQLAMQDYNQIVKYETVMDQVAMDVNINFVNNKERSSLKEKQLQIPVIGITNVDIQFKVQQIPQQLNDTQYNAFQLFQFEINILTEIIDDLLQQSAIWKYTDLLQKIKQYKYIPNPKFLQDKLVLYVIKRKQYRIINDFILPNIDYDIDCLFKTQQLKIQHFKAQGTNVIYQQIINETIQSLNESMQQKHDEYTIQLQYVRFYQYQIKLQHQQIIMYLIESQQFKFLIMLYGAFILFVSQTYSTTKQYDCYITLGQIYEHNQYNTEINGFLWNQVLYLFQQKDNQWIMSQKSVPIVNQIISQDDGQMLGFFSDKMKFKILKSDTGGKHDKKRLRKGIICSSHNQLGLKQLYHDTKKLYLQYGTKDDIIQIQQSIIQITGKRTYCDIMMLILISLDLHQFKQVRWFYLFDSDN